MGWEGFGAGDSGPAFLVSAGIVYEIIAAACSSPQTTELNAEARAPTLMKWVNIGVAQAAIFVFIAAAIDRRKAAIISGGLLAGALMYGSYVHARNAGTTSPGEPTEVYT